MPKGYPKLGEIKWPKEKVSKGVSRRTGSKEITINIPLEMHETIRKRAIKDGRSFAAEARLLLEWALEDYGEAN